METTEVPNNNGSNNMGSVIESVMIAAIMRCEPSAGSNARHEAQQLGAIMTGTTLTEPLEPKVAQTKPHTAGSTAKVADEPSETTLWTVAQAAKFLRKSERWMFGQLTLDESQTGSIPHVRLGRSPRFIPAELREWSAAGFPPAAAFKEMKDAEKRKRGRI